MYLADSILALCGLLGHSLLWTWMSNRLHSVAMPRRLISGISKVMDLFLLGIPTVFIWWQIDSGRPLPWRFSLLPEAGPVFYYFVLCWIIAAWGLPRWARQRFSSPEKSLLLSNHTTRLDIAKELGYRPVAKLSGVLLDKIPGNQSCRIHVHEKIVSVPRLDPKLDGLSITHLSDFHFTGRIEKPYFERLVQHANNLNADLVVITGDIVDHDSYLQWIPETLGKLRSRQGVFFVLGNHDRRVSDVPALRKRLTDGGLVDLGGKWKNLEINGSKILIAGNELPWFGPAAEAEEFKDATGLRILLSHSPDQLPWAKARDFDLMLAGHTHGGQICFPVIGPVVCPSRFGVKYASGLFYESPTVMHVSRGISGLVPIRINCAPELTKLVLRSPQKEPIAG